jgi:hypothetical protein
LSRPSSSCLGLCIASAELVFRPGSLLRYIRYLWFFASAGFSGFYLLDIITNSIRRNQRRQRARARLAWFLHKRGLCILDSQQLSALHYRLRRHHSRDHHFLGRLRSEMSRLQSDSHGWFCGTCRKMRSPQAHFCDLCGQSWQDCIQYPSKNAPRRGQAEYYDGYAQGYEETPWAGHSWTESPRNSPRKSPRQPSGRRTKQRPQKKGQGKGANKGKEKGNSAMASQAAPPPPPPLTGPNAAPAPWMSMPQPPQETQIQEHPAE